MRAVWHRCGILALAAVSYAWAQEVGKEPAEIEDIIVIAQKEPAPAQSVPLSVTPVPLELLTDADVRSVKEAVSFAPDALVVEFGPRRLSNPYFRGVGAGPTNPGVVTVIDGVPQMNAASTSIDLLDVEQVEIAMGPEGALFGRNALGGLVFVTSRPPSDTLTLSADAIFGSFATADARLRLSGPAGGGGFSLAVASSRRDGYTKNALTGKDVDSRESSAAKAQVVASLTDRLDARLILFGERDRDGGYALGDLGQMRIAPRQVAYDCDGFSRRDIVMPTAVVRYRADAFDMTATTGYVSWQIEELTDLDYSPLPLMVNRNDEDQWQVSQEIRFSSREGRGALSRWQAGVFCFRERYERERVVDLLPMLTGMPIVLTEESGGRIATAGVGIYGQATYQLGQNGEVTVGMRCDTEQAKADLVSVSALGVETRQHWERSYGEFSPQAAVVYRFRPGAMGYLSVARGYKAGGFNMGAPAGNEVYGEETCWSWEAGVKSEWNDGRILVNAAAYSLRWDDVQVYVPNPLTPGNFYVDNAAGARSSGIEVQARCRPVRGWEFSFAAGVAGGEFSSGSTMMGVPVAGNRLPFLPDFTVRAGVQYSRTVGVVDWYGRADLSLCGDYEYDALNAAAQSTFAVTDVRTGVRGHRWSAELWAKNVFDEEYVPVALPYGALAPSGYIGESGAPRTVGVRAAVFF